MRYMYLRIPTSSIDSLSLDGSDGDLLPEFVSSAHANVSKDSPYTRN
jgi:chitinase